MKKIAYYEGQSCAPASDDEMAAFKKKAGIQSLSPTFITFCQTQNGGSPNSTNDYFYPRPIMADYWNFCKQRVINPAGLIDVSDLLGVTSVERFSTAHWSDNAHQIWHLRDDFFCVAYDGIGSRLVSRLREGDDKVYYWEPHVEPHFFLIAEDLAEFYGGLEANRHPYQEGD